MPDPYLGERRNGMKAEILRRVSVGESVSAICREPGWPDRDTVLRWARKDLSFAEGLAAAARVGAFHLRGRFDMPKAEAFLARLRAGERLADILRDPAMPSHGTLRYWRRTQIDFGAEVLRVIEVRKQQNLHRIRPSRQFGPALVDRILLALGRGVPYRDLHKADAGLPCHRILDRWRREHPHFDHEVRVNRAMGRLPGRRGRARAMVRRRTEALTDQIAGRIIAGESINSLGGTGGLPAASTLYKWLARDAQFARDMELACDMRRDRLMEAIEAIADQAQGLGVTETRRRMAPLSARLGRLEQQRPGGKWLGR